MIEICLPIRIKSPNQKEHWTVSYKRNKRIAQAIGFTLRTHKDLARIAQMVGVTTSGWFGKKNSTQVKIKITLIKRGRAFDFDNMVYGFKVVRDTLCGFFFPDLAPGQADSQKCFEFVYLQEKGGSGIKILLEFYDKNGEIL